MATPLDLDNQSAGGWKDRCKQQGSDFSHGELRVTIEERLGSNSQGTPPDLAKPPTLDMSPAIA
jgi:hypothetical protein